MRRGLAESRAVAQEAVAAGLVTVDGAPARKPAAQVLPEQALHVHAPPRRFVSRGGHKLAHALATFDVSIDDRLVVDAGISTGGFTDCALQHGARHVVGVDVGYGQVHERLRTDDRVTVHERTNVRDVTPSLVRASFAAAGHGEVLADVLVADLSFIALSLVLPGLVALVGDEGLVLALVKPQFEAGREQVGRGGVVRDPRVWGDTLDHVADAARALSWRVAGATASPITGPAGNVEFMVHLVAGGDERTDGWDAMRERALEEGRAVAGRSGP